MSKLTLTWNAAATGRIDCGPLIPDNLLGKTQAEIGKIRITIGRQTLPVAKLFKIEGSPKSADEVVLRGFTGRFSGQADHIGMAMTGGKLTVYGTAGDFIGHNMQDGQLIVRGSAGRWAGRGMRSGLLEIHGDAGDYLASAFPGDTQGLRKGVIHVRGNAGQRIGERMRRGIVVIDGDVGDYCGAKMLAGTIIVCGATGRYTGAGMKRGTILLLEAPELPATFNDCGDYEPAFLALLYRYLGRTSRHLKDLLDWPISVRRMAGDAAVGGKGEVLVLQE